MNCRHCQNKLEHVFLDLGFAPPSNSYLKKEDLSKEEVYYPLKIYVCSECWLVQTADYAQREEFFNDHYSYFSSISESWLVHAKDYSNKMIEYLSLNGSSRVIEIGSNDGYLLQYFVQKGIDSLGIEPTLNTAEKAVEKGIPVLKEFFSLDLAEELSNKYEKADLVIGNNVYAHVPDINNFTAGIKKLLKPEGIVTLEFPHLLNLIKYNQFDTVYHEHYSYFTVHTVVRIFEKQGLRIFKIEKISTHGGSIRVYGCNIEDPRNDEESLEDILKEEEDFGLMHIDIYSNFQKKVNYIKNNLLSFLIEKKKKNELVAGYGAAAKGNTLLNYAGIKPDLLSFVCDAAPSKQQKYMPGSHIPILHPREMMIKKPKWILIFPWNISDEVLKQQKELKEYGGQFLVAIPELSVVS